MTYFKTSAYKKIKALRKRIRVVQGGTAASKSVSIVIWLIALAQSDTAPTLTSIVSESFPHLKRGVMRDFRMIMEAQGYFVPTRWNSTDCVYTFETGSKIEFFSADQPGKVRGPRRDRLFINEANNVPFETFEQLEVRTKDFVFCDFNPVADFWIFDEVIGKRDDVDHIIVTYQDNEALAPQIVASIESRKNRKGWFDVYGRGILGEVEGKIYKDWKIIDDVPHEARLARYGLDFGYTNDPTAVVAVYKYNGGFILDEITFQKGLLNNQIADIVKNQERALVVADSAEPKSIDDIRACGIDIIPCEKGPDSVRNGIAVVQQQRISMTKRSVNIIKEYRNYLWMVDKDGKITQEPEHAWSHGMDSSRYAIANLVKNDSDDEKQFTNIEGNDLRDVYEPSWRAADSGSGY